MARKKAVPAATFTGGQDRLFQKTFPLFALWNCDLTKSDLQILDLYLSKLDRHKPDKRIVVFEYGEIETAMGMQKIHREELEARLRHLMEKVIEMPLGDPKKGFRLIKLFEEADAKLDHHGRWCVKLECTPTAMKLFSCCKNLAYLRYKIRCVMPLTSRHSYMMFLYLEANRCRKSWEVSVDELKEIFCCKEESCLQLEDLLKNAYIDINEKTECRYQYEPVKNGQCVAAVKFTLEDLPKSCLEDFDPNQITIEQWQNTPE